LQFVTMRAIVSVLIINKIKMTKNMTNTQDANPNTPKTYVENIDKARFMAYSGKPYREDALTLGRMAAKAKDDPVVEEYDSDKMSLNWLPEAGDYTYPESLEKAQSDTLDLAVKAEEAAGEAYDEHEQAKKKFDEAQQRFIA